MTQIHASEVTLNSHAAGNLARSAAYLGPRAGLEVKGLNAPVHLAAGGTTFYVRINSDDPELMRKRIHLVRLQQTKDRRVVASYSQNVFGGQREKKYNEVEVLKEDAEPDVWLKLVPKTPLVAGEYGIVIMPKDASMWPDAVYDFDVDFDKALPDKDASERR